MFKVILNGENRLDIEMSGSLDAEAMRVALDELVEKSAAFEKGKMLFDVIDFHLPSLKAIFIEFARFPSMIGFIKRFDRAAVLTDKDWLKKISELEGVLFRNLQIKAFRHDQREEAEAWLTEQDQRPG